MIDRWKRSYTECIQLKSFDERLEYLMLKGFVGDFTFGGHRLLNQRFYNSNEWKTFRSRIIARDLGYDLGNGEEINSEILVHHINPITIEDIIIMSPMVLHPDNAITTWDKTHKTIHYAHFLPKSLPNERTPGDTKLW